MPSLDGNLIAVQWGLIGAYGVFVGLNLSTADRFLREYKSSGDSVDQKRAANWANSVKFTTLLVLAALCALSVLGAWDAGLKLNSSVVTAHWLLLAPIVAQAGFVILVLKLVDRVPPHRQVQLAPRPQAQKSPEVTSSETTILFRNQTSAEVAVWWIDFGGGRVLTDRVPAKGKARRATYEGHIFVITTPEGSDLGWAVAQEDPIEVAIQNLAA